MEEQTHSVHFLCVPLSTLEFLSSWANDFPAEWRSITCSSCYRFYRADRPSACSGPRSSSLLRQMYTCLCFRDRSVKLFLRAYDEEIYHWGLDCRYLLVTSSTNLSYWTWLIHNYMYIVSSSPPPLLSLSGLPALSHVWQHVKLSDAVSGPVRDKA